MQAPDPRHPTPIDSSSFKRILTRAVLLPLILMAILSGLFLWQISRLLAASQWVDHTDEVIARANGTQKLLVDMETGQRGYLITGRQEFLEPYDRAARQIDPAFGDLGRLISDNPTQGRHLDELRAQYARWSRIARDEIAARDGGGDYQSLISGGEGKRAMDATRAQFASFIETEEALRNERTQVTRQTTRLAIGTGLVAALMLGGLLAVFIRRQLVSVSRSYGRALLTEQEQRQWLNTTLTSIGDAVIVTDAEGRVTLVNAVAETVTGWKSSEAIRRPLPEVFQIVNEETRREVENPVAKVLREGGIVGLANHTLLIAKDGQEIPIDDSGAPIKDEEGKIIGVVLVFRDITERKRAEKERERLLLEAEEVNRLKDEFLATASHELRTPLTAIVGWTRMLRAGNLDEATSARALETIERNANAQTKLIEDLLDISRIITGKLQLDTQPVEVAPVVSAAVNTVRPAADAKNIEIGTNIDSEAGLVLADVNRLQQVIWNLLSNAVKFTPKEGNVSVRLRRVDSQVEISVCDTGDGIEPEFLPYVFDRFRQADGRTTRKHGGLGLGLAIVRNLVEMHGGTVKARSEGRGRGATFSVRLPLLGQYSRIEIPTATVAGEVIEAATALSLEGLPKLDGIRVLIVDDDADTREMLDAVLSECEAEVVTAASAAEALQEIKRRKPDVLVSDIGMPDEDGYELIKKVRELEIVRGDTETPALALTAYAKAEDRVRALAAGYQVHLSKPVEPGEFALVVAQLVCRGSAAPWKSKKHGS